jgi:hypothetical protein
MRDLRPLEVANVRRGKASENGKLVDLGGF